MKRRRRKKTSAEMMKAAGHEYRSRDKDGEGCQRRETWVESGKSGGETLSFEVGTAGAKTEAAARQKAAAEGKDRGAMNRRRLRVTAEALRPHNERRRGAAESGGERRRVAESGGERRRAAESGGERRRAAESGGERRRATESVRVRQSASECVRVRWATACRASTG